MCDVIDPKEELLIASFVTGIDPQSLQLGAHQLTKEQIEKISALIEKRVQGIPFEHVIGNIDFFDVSLIINGSVLIPRPETEIFVERALQEIPKGEVGKSALDLCTGSGCVGLAVKKQRSNLEMVLSDISKPAIDVAEKNAKRNHLEVEIVSGHLFDGVKGRQFDYLFSNPPYVTESAYLGLDKSVKDHEPKIALCGGVDGLMFYRMIEKEAKKCLKPGAKCFFEIGFDQGDSVLEIFSDRVWKSKTVSKDYAGHDRFFFLEFLP